MSKTMPLTAGLFLSGLMIATGYAGPNDGAVTPQKNNIVSTQSGTSVQAAPPKDGLSKRNKAVIEQSKASQMRRDNIRSSGSGTTPKKSGLSKRNQAKLKQEEASKKMHEQMRTSPSPTQQK